MKLYPKLVKKTFMIKEKTDLVIAGLGWVTIQNQVRYLYGVLKKLT